MIPIFTDISDLGMDTLCKSGFTSALRHRQPIRVLYRQVIPVELPTIRQRGNSFQTKINSNVDGAGIRGKVYNTHNVDIPATTSIFVETDGTNICRDLSCIPKSEGLASELNTVACNLHILVSAWNPTKTAPGSFGLTPGQLASFGVESSSPVFLANLLDGLGVKPEFLANSVGEFHQIISRKPLTMPPEHVKGSLIAVVPNQVDGFSPADQMLTRRATVLDPKLVGSYILQGFLTRSSIGTGLRQDVEGGASPSSSMDLPPCLSNPKSRLISPCLKAGALRRFHGKCPQCIW